MLDVLQVSALNADIETDSEEKKHAGLEVDNNFSETSNGSKPGGSKTHSRLSLLAMKRARKEEDLQDTPGIFCSQVSRNAPTVKGDVVQTHLTWRDFRHRVLEGDISKHRRSCPFHGYTYTLFVPYHTHMPLNLF